MRTFSWTAYPTNPRLYLSPTVDCFDGMLVTWRISEDLNADLVNGLLDDVIANIGIKSKPIIHTD